jgi:DNA-binding transcriptional regulator YhcF (GntR family)
MKPGIRMDLQDKLTKGVFIPPLDLEKIAQDVYNAINNVVQAKLAMRVMGIGLTEILQLLKEICEEDKITYLKKDGSVPNS